MVAYDAAVYLDLDALVLRPAGGYGWEGTGHGPGYGGLAVQGLLPPLCDERRAGDGSRPRGVELSECRCTAGFAQPRHDATTKGAPSDAGKGTAGLPEARCEGCRRNVSLSRGDVATAHFASCGKLRRCWDVTEARKYGPHRPKPGFDHQRLCTELHGIWFGLRREAGEVLARKGQLTGRFLRDVFGGYCRSSGFKGCVPLKFV
jgi:hypothetical protein